MKVRLLVALTFLSCSIALAAPPQKQQYIVKLKYLYQQPNASVAAPLKDVVTHGGGHVDYEGWDRLVVTLPDNAVEAIAKHSATKYMQLVRTGPPTPRGATQTVSTSSVNAGAPSAVARALSAPLRPAPTSSSTWDSGTYVYDGAGNITGIGTDSFTYDSLSRLATSSIKGNTETYTYDQFGNLIYKTTHPAQGPALPVDLTTSTATNRLSAQPYDTAGNLTGTAATELNIYDPFNMLREKDISSNSAREFYLYNANDERIAVISNPCGVTPPNCAGAMITVSGRDEGGHVLRQFDLPYLQYATTTPWLWLEDYVYRDGLLLAADREAADGGRRHFHLDHLGSPRLVTGDGGAHLATHDYYPFGVEITSMRQETLAGFDREEPMKFTGHERDFNIGVLTENSNYNDYMHARSTVPQWGRFMSVDRGPVDPTQPQSWNRYAYVLNNPINTTDPRGLCGEGVGFVGPVVPCEVKLSPPKNAANWTPEQRAAENAKNAQRAQLAEEGKLVVNRGQVRPSSSQVAGVNGGPAPAGSQLDHTQELVLNGAPLAKGNIASLDATVNMSSGARVKNAIAGLADGTVITQFSYTALSAGNVAMALIQSLSYNTFVQNQEAAHPGFVNMNDMARWATTGDTRPSPPPCGNPGAGPC